MRFHLIDKLSSYTLWEEATAIKNVTLGNQEFINSYHYIDDSLLMESIFQCAAWLIVISSDQRFRPTIVTVDNFTVHKHISVGQQIFIKVHIKERFEEFVTISGKIYCGDELCVALEDAILMLIETKDIEDPSLTSKYIKYLVS